MILVHVMILVLEADSENTLSQRMKLSRLRRLGYVLLMMCTRLPYGTLFSISFAKWKNLRESQKVTWKRGVGKCTTKLGK